jgi:hypothetical protein
LRADLRRRSPAWSQQVKPLCRSECAHFAFRGRYPIPLLYRWLDAAVSSLFFDNKM